MNKNKKTVLISLTVFGILSIIFVNTAFCERMRLSTKPSSFPVLNGNQQAVIVYNPSDTGYFVNAYQDLASYLQKTTGKTFAVMTESTFNSIGAKFPIYVGNCTATQQAIGTQLANVDRDGFIIVVESKRVFINGPKDYSTYWGVLQFLEDYIGVRWLMPGTLGEDVLAKSKIMVPPVRRIEQPVIPSRQWSGYTLGDSGGTWTMRMRVKQRYYFHHNMTTIFPPATYYTTHPEYYAYVNGTRIGPNQNGAINICYTNPDTPGIAANAARSAFASTPDRESFSFGPDDSAQFCQCAPGIPPAHAEPYCDQLFVHTLPNTPYWNTYWGSAEAADLYFTWLKRVADNLATTHPTKFVGTLSYDRYTAWPLNVTLSNSQIMPYICHATADRYVPSYRSACEDLITEWSNRCKQIGMYDYAYGESFVLPRIYSSLIQDELQFALRYHLKGVYAEQYPNWGFDAPRIYMTAKLWWNPYIDRQAVQDDWCNRMFKEATVPMKRHFERCESEWVNYDGYLREPTAKRLGGFSWSPWVFTQGGKTSDFEVFTPEVCAASTADFDQAAAIAQNQTVKNRLQFFRKTWDLGMVFANAYWAGEGLNSYISRGCNLQQAVNALKKMPSSYDTSYFYGEISNRVGNDYMAFYPVSVSEQTWWNSYCIPKEAGLLDFQWVGNQIATEALTQPQPQRQSYIDSKITTLFGTSLNTKLQKVVDLIRNMAYDQGGVFPIIPQGTLMAYYKFNETSGNYAYDLTSHHLMATLAGNTLWSNDAARGRCVYLDGDNDYIYFGTFGKNLDKDLTITCWTKVDDVTRSAGLIEGWTNANVVKMASYLPANTTAQGGTIWVSWNGGNSPSQIIIDTSMLGYTSNNTWYHWAFTRNGTTGEIKLYMNGALKATGTGGNSTLTDLACLRMGYMNKTSFKGYLDDVSFWSKPLSDAEVADIYTNGIDVNYAPPIVWYKLNDRARNTATNFSEAGSIYNGTFVPLGGPLWVWGTDQHGTSTWTLSFNGTDNCISVPSAVLSQISDKATITFWQKGNTGSQCDLFFAKKSDDSTILSCKLPWVNGSNNYVTWDAGSPLDTVSKIASVSDYTGTWNHWVLSKNTSTGQMKIYLNGTLWHSGTSKTSLMSGGSTMQIGTGPDGFYSGYIADFRIYNVELSTDGIVKVMSGS